MTHITIPHTDLTVSRICAGCMGLGGGFDKNATITREVEQQARIFIETALELGINFFDHANIYARGRAEEVFGRILKEHPGMRSQMVLQSKCGIRWADDPPGSPQRFDFSYGHIIESVDATLERLHTDYLDILLLHRPDVLMEGEEVARAFETLKKSGKVRYFGLSNHNRFQMEYLQHFVTYPLVANQLQMSLLHHGFAEVGISFNQAAPGYPDGWEGMMEYARLQGVMLQAWSPLDRGMLLKENLSQESETVQHTAALVKQYAHEHGVPPEAIALAWLLRHPAGIVPITGTSKAERLRACVEADRVSLSREEWYRLFESARGKPMP